MIMRFSNFAILIFTDFIFAEKGATAKNAKKKKRSLQKKNPLHSSSSS